LIHLQHAIQRAQVDGDRWALARVLHSADHAGAAAERDRHDVGSLGPLEDGGEVLLVARAGHHVRRVVELTAETTHHIPVGLAQSVGGALVVARVADARQRRRRLNSRSAQLQILEWHGALDLTLSETEVGSDPGRSLHHLLVWELLILVAPTPVLEPTALARPWHGRALCHARRGAVGNRRATVVQRLVEDAGIKARLTQHPDGRRLGAPCGSSTR